VTDKLLPCPFCGETDIEFQTGTEDREGWPRNAACAKCGACGPWTYCPHDDDKIEPLKLWNARKGEGEK